MLAGFLSVAALYGARSLSSQSRVLTVPVLYEGAQLIAGDGRAPILSAAMLVEN